MLIDKTKMCKSTDFDGRMFDSLSIVHTASRTRETIPGTVPSYTRSKRTIDLPNARAVSLFESVHQRSVPVSELVDWNEKYAQK